MWTPDGRWILFPSARSGSLTLWRVAFGGGTPEPVTTGAGEDTAPAISPDGKSLIFTNARNNWSLVLLDPAPRRSQRELLSQREDIVMPTFSPEGDRIAFFQHLGSDVHLFVVGTDSGGLRQVTRDIGQQNIMPIWSEDGNSLYLYQVRPLPSFRKLAISGATNVEVAPWTWGKQNFARVDSSGHTAVYTLSERGRPPSHPELEREAASKREAADLLNSFVAFIYAQLERWLGLTDEHFEKLHYLRNLIEICGDGHGVDIFSLNYDLCIENALRRFAKKDFVNGFTAEEGWKSETLAVEAPIRLFKLHGSLDWVEDQAYGLCSLQFPRYRVAENIEGDNVRPLLIFGTAHKLSPREPFLSLAYAFSQTVLKTTVLAVVGYSFGDGYVNQIIRQGIEKNPKLRVFVVGPSADRLVNTVSFLQGRQPRVVGLKANAEDALSKGQFLRSLREFLEGASNEEPFTEDASETQPQ